MTQEFDELLKAVSRSFYLSMRFLPNEMRDVISLGYLLARLTDTVADASGIELNKRIELLDQIRKVVSGKSARVEGLEGLASTLSHEGEAELVRRSGVWFELYHQVDPSLKDHLSEVILTIIHGQRWDVTFFEGDGVVACPTSDDLFRYTYRVAGCVGEFWTKVGYTTLGEGFASPDQSSRMLVLGKRLGQALQLTNILRDLHEDLPAGRCYLPAEELEKMGWVQGSQPEVSELEPSFVKWTGVCQDYLDEAHGYCLRLRNFRTKLTTRLPMLLAEKTVGRLCEAGVETVMNTRVKIPRSDVWLSLARATFF
ncbi:MAG: squalene/phytoene synthase family protein [Verrucomicrobiota bacterium]